MSSQCGDAHQQRIGSIALEYSIAAGNSIKRIERSTELTAHAVFSAYRNQAMLVDYEADSIFIDHTNVYNVKSMKAFVKEELYKHAAEELERWSFTSESFLVFVEQMNIRNSNYAPIFFRLWHNRTARAACKDIDASAGTGSQCVNLRMLVKLWTRYVLKGFSHQDTVNDLTELMALFPELYTPEPDSEWSSVLEELGDGVYEFDRPSLPEMQADSNGNHRYLCYTQELCLKLSEESVVRPTDMHRGAFNKALFHHVTLRRDHDLLRYLFGLSLYGRVFKEVMARMCLHENNYFDHMWASDENKRNHRTLRMLFSMSASGGCISPLRITRIPHPLTIEVDRRWIRWSLWERVRWAVKVRKYALHWLEEWTKAVCRAEFDTDGSALMLGPAAKRMRIENMLDSGVKKEHLKALEDAAEQAEAARRCKAEKKESVAEELEREREREREERRMAARVQQQ